MPPVPSRVQCLPNYDPQRECQHVQSTICAEALACAFCSELALQVLVPKIQERTLHSVRSLRGALLSLDLSLMLAIKDPYTTSAWSIP